MESTRRTKETAVVPLVFLLFFGFLLAVNCRQYYETTVLDVQGPVGFKTKASDVQGKEVLSLSDGAVGSSPPDCTAKCGSCVPCVPVVVTMKTPPGTPPENNFGYYPQGWACQCGNQLFVP